MRVGVLIVGAVMVAWGACLAGSFHFDDYNLLIDPVVTAGRWSPWQTRPLSQFTFWLSFVVGGRVPWTWHVWNLVLHAFASVLVWRVLRGVIGERAAVGAGFVFAVHPVQSEVVNYVFARSTALSTVLCLGVLGLWWRGRVWWAVGVFGLALLAKEECVTLPLVIVLMEWGRSGAARKGAPTPISWMPGRGIAGVGAMVGLALVLGGRVMLATRFVPQGGGGFASVVSPWQYFTAQGLVILRDFRLLIFPWGFTVDPEISIVWPWAAWGAVGLIGFLAWRNRRTWGIWVLAGMILLMPSSSIFPADDLAADRRMYLPMIAFAAAIGMVAQRTNPRLLAVLGAILVALSFGRTQVWRTERELWTEAIERSPGKVRPRIQLARAVNPEEGLGVLDGGRFPENFDTETERGRLLLKTNRAGEALAAFGRALALKPSSAMAFSNRGVALAALGQNDASRADFERALRADPCFAEAADNLRRLGFSAPDGFGECLNPASKTNYRF